MISEREKQEIAEVYLERGIEQGIEQGKIDDAKRMLAHGYDVAEIMAITKLPESEIEALKSTQLT